MVHSEPRPSPKSSLLSGASDGSMAWCVQATEILREAYAMTMGRYHSVRAHHTFTFRSSEGVVLVPDIGCPGDQLLSPLRKGNVL